MAGLAGSGRHLLFDSGRTRWNLLAVVPAALVAFAVLSAVLPPRSGPLALALTLEEHLFIAVLVVLTPVALLTRARLLGLALVVVVVAGGGFFGSEWISLPGGATRHDLSVMSWNLQAGARTPAEAAAQLEGVKVDLIALQELEPDASAAIEADPVITARYPHREMQPRAGSRGVAILSRYPIMDLGFPGIEAEMQVVLDAPQGRVHVINAHPMPASIETITPLRLPIDFNPAQRDAAIATVKGGIDLARSAGERVLVLGDFNTAPSEPENAVLTEGLRDTHVEVGEGPGWTWRPSRFTFLPVAFLRIDRQLTAGAIYPVSTSVECSLPGDHCRLFGDYEIDG